jgi:hypothetical protein
MAEIQPSISIVYDCTQNEREQGIRLIPSPQSGKRQPGSFRRGLLGWLLFIATAAILFVWLKDSAPVPARRPIVHTGAPDLSIPVKISILVFLIGAAIWAGGFVLTSIARRTGWRRWNGVATYSFDDAGVTFRRPGRVDQYRWPHFLGVEEGHDVFVIRTNARMGMIFPKRLFGSDQQRFRTLLQSHVVRPAIPLAMGFEVNHP